MATTLYHATPSDNRDSILTHGLDINHGRRLFIHDDDPKRTRLRVVTRAAST